MAMVARHHDSDAALLGLVDDALRSLVGGEVAQTTVAVEKDATVRLLHDGHVRRVVEPAISHQDRIGGDLRRTVAENTAQIVAGEQAGK